MARWIVVANAECRRLQLFSAALHQCGQAAPVVVNYADIMRERVRLAEVVRPGDCVRLESPGRDWEVEKLLLARGAAATEDEARFHFLNLKRIENLNFARGRLWPSRQWFHGLSWLLHELENQLAECASHFSLHAPRDILTLFDKPACHEILRQNAVPVAPGLGVPENFADLWQRLQNANEKRVFVKLAHGSSASGVVAFSTNGSAMRALTTTEMVRDNGEIKLYNSRRPRIYQDAREIETLIDALCRERVWVEKWLPKARCNGQNCDVRWVGIAGRMRHGVVRLSRHALTNLHLLNQRAPLESLQSQIDPADWQRARDSCERALGLFPDSLSIGLDVVFSPQGKRHAILELNAWGDLLPNLVEAGQSVYQAQIMAALQRRASAASTCSTAFS